MTRAEPRPRLSQPGGGGYLRFPLQEAIRACRVQAHAPHLEFPRRQKVGCAVPTRLREQPLDDGVNTNLTSNTNVQLSRGAAEDRGQVGNGDIPNEHEISRLTAV